MYSVEGDSRQNRAMLASILETCKLNQVEPHGYVMSVVKQNGTSERLEQWRLWLICVIDYAACF